MKNLALKPILSEKSHTLSHDGTYMFEVPMLLNKHEIGQVVAEQFKVEVAGVRVARLSGKTKQSWQRKRRSVSGQRADVKRAYVSLAEGFVLPFFESEHDHNHKHEVKDTKAKTPKSKEPK